MFNDSMSSPDSKVHGANMGPIWGRQDPGEPHVGPMNFAIWDLFSHSPRGYFTGSGTIAPMPVKWHWETKVDWC